MTYLIWYVTKMYDALQEGGNEETVFKRVNEINNPTSAAFDEYMKTAQDITCGACGGPFVPDAPALDKEMLCLSCATEKSTEETPPV